MRRFDGSLWVIALVCGCDPQKGELATVDALPEVVSTNARYLQLDVHVLPSVSLSSLDPFLALLLGGHVTLLALAGPPGESLPSTSHRPPPPWSFSWILIYIDQAPMLKKIWVCHSRPQDLKSVTYPEYHWAIRDIPVAHMLVQSPDSEIQVSIYLHYPSLSSFGPYSKGYIVHSWPQAQHWVPM